MKGYRRRGKEAVEYGLAGGRGGVCVFVEAVGGGVSRQI